MPEGNTVHRYALEHDEALRGRRISVTSPQGRFSQEAAELDGRRFLRAEAWGKHLFHFWQGRLVVHVHLGMFGRFTRFDGEAPEPRPTVRMRLAAGKRAARPAVTIDLAGAPACELMTTERRRSLLARLGPDPLRGDADPERIWSALRARDRPIGDALLDQRVIAGVGNIYRNEALFLTAIHPLRPSNTINRREWLLLWETILRLMRRGLRQGRIATVEPGETPHRSSGRGPRDAFYVYRREICRRCGARIRMFPLSGRKMFACEKCQPIGRAARRNRDK
ncbi:MAG: DNA-formamidopyrimidine glycosylase family protein [Acidobacteriota bacterium]